MVGKIVGSSRATTNLYARLEKEKDVNICCIDQSVRAKLPDQSGRRESLSDCGPSERMSAISKNATDSNHSLLERS